MTKLTDNEKRKAMIQNGFDTVAPGYDCDALAFFPETARRLIDQLNLKPHHQLLDVCCGTGVVSLAAAQKLTNGGVTGIDLSSGMLEQARRKASAENLTNINFQQMDLEHLDIPEGSFDVATSSFGLFFLEDMKAALKNIASTVRTGGSVAITTFTGEAFSPMSDIFIKNYEATGRKVPPLSWKRLATNELIEEHFNAVGISDISIHHEPLGYQMTDVQQWWDVVWNAGWRSLLNQMSEEEQKDFKEEHLKEVSEVLGIDGVWFNTEVLIAVGEK